MYLAPSTYSIFQEAVLAIVVFQGCEDGDSAAAVVCMCVSVSVSVCGWFCVVPWEMCI